MKKLSAAFLVVALAFAVLAAGDLQAQEDAGPEREAVEAAIRSVMGAMREAAGRFDADALYAHVLDSETLPIIENGRLALTHSDALRRTAEGFRGLTRLSYRYTQENITVTAPNTVLWVASGTASATLADGREITTPFAETIVFIWNENRWRVLHAHRSVPN
jgi:ketosteroid isomerase-like protein